MNTTLFASTSLTTNTSMQAVILAAGQGSRLKTGITKLATPICGQAMALYAIRLMQKLAIPTTVVIGYQKEIVKKIIESAQIPGLIFTEQQEQLGTGHALMCSKDTWQADHLLVMNGDMPLLTAEVIRQLTEQHFATHAAISFSACYNVDPANTFGRIIEKNGQVKVVEKKHFTRSIQDHPYVNAGIYLIHRKFLETYLHHIKQNELSHEFYITDLIELANDHALPVTPVTFPFEPFNGVNTFAELAIVEKIKRNELIHYWMEQGVRFIHPDTVHLDLNVTIARGTVISAGVQVLNGTTVGEFCTIGAHAVLDNAHLADHVTIGAQTVIENSTIPAHTSVPAGTLQSSVSHNQHILPHTKRYTKENR